jgi:hypothetical protein
MSSIERRELDNEEMKIGAEICTKVTESVARGQPVSILELTPEFNFLKGRSYCLWLPHEKIPKNFKTLFFFDHIIAPFPRSSHPDILSAYGLTWDALVEAVKSKKLLLFLEHKPNAYPDSLNQLFDTCKLAGYNPPMIALRFLSCLGDLHLDWAKHHQKSGNQESLTTTTHTEFAPDEVLHDMMSRLSGSEGDEIIRKFTGITCSMSERDKIGYALDMTQCILTLCHAGFSDILESLTSRSKGNTFSRFGMILVNDRYLLSPKIEALFGFSLWNYEIDLKQITYLEEYSELGYEFCDSNLFHEHALHIPRFEGRIDVKEFQELTDLYDSHADVMADIRRSVGDFKNATEAGRPDLAASASSRISEVFNERLSPRIIEKLNPVEKSIEGALLGFGTALNKNWPSDVDSIRRYRENHLWPLSMASFAIGLEDYRDAITLVAEAMKEMVFDDVASQFKTKKWLLNEWWPFKERTPLFLLWIPSS